MHKNENRYAWACLVALLGLTACNRYRAPAPAGAWEAAVRHLMLSDAPVERRFAGLFEYFSRGFVDHATPGRARVQFAGAGSVSGYSINGLEGFARTAPLLAAWIYSGREGSAGWASILRTGILNGVDPHSREYWGNIGDHDQKIVEAADIARVIWLSRAQVWSRLSAEQQQMIVAWLATAAAKQMPPNNWMLFPVVINLVLASLHPEGAPAQLLAKAHAQFTDYRQYYLEHGWFYDRPHGVDFYNTWGITYDLFWIHAVSPSFEPEFITGALAQSAELTQHLISPRGIPIVGRSVCYRTAVPVPLIAATFLGPDIFPAGRAVRGLDVVWRYFVGHDSLRDGALTQGYFDTDLRWLDRYSGAGSCHWGLRSLVLAFMHPAGDEFWSAAQQPLPVEVADYRLELSKLGWIVDGRRDSAEITVTIPANPADVRSAQPYTWFARTLDSFSRNPHRPNNHASKYESRHYSSATPFPLKD